jgi:hypothetical protein
MPGCMRLATPGLDGGGFNFWQVRRFFSSPPHGDRLSGPVIPCPVGQQSGHFERKILPLPVIECRSSSPYQATFSAVFSFTDHIKSVCQYMTRVTLRDHLHCIVQASNFHK